MVIQITLCDARVAEPFLIKEKIVYDVTRGRFKDRLRPQEEELELTREISTLCWRLLEAPDFFWDNNVREVMAWYESGNGPKPKEEVSFWPLWTVEDALNWIKAAGCSIFKIYVFKETSAAEVYIRLENGELVYETGGILLIVLLKFILKKLKSGAKCMGGLKEKP